MLDLENQIFTISSYSNFQSLAIKIFHHQYQNCTVYSKYVNYLGIKSDQVKKIDDVPFLPIEFFKSFDIVTGSYKPDLVFTSSGTTSLTKSRHLVKKSSLYKASFTKTFQQFYGSPEKYCVLAMLPSYIEQGNSSLVYMADELIRLSLNPNSGFYMNNHKELYEKLQKLEQTKQSTILLGVSYALLDFAENYKPRLNKTIVMETGGMKGRRKEIIREELHQHLKEAFGLKNVHSEYGMTECLSQAYDKQNRDNIEHLPGWKFSFGILIIPFLLLKKAKMEV